MRKSARRGMIQERKPHHEVLDHQGLRTQQFGMVDSTVLANVVQSWTPKRAVRIGVEDRASAIEANARPAQRVLRRHSKCSQ